MEQIKSVMAAMGLLPKLRLGIKLQKGGVKSSGPHRVKFLSEPEGVTKKDFEGKPQKMLRFELEENGIKYHWYARVLNKEGEANYLLERLVDIKPGDERILEMSRQGARNYVDVRDVNEPARKPEIDEMEDEEPEEEEEKKEEKPATEEDNAELF